MEKLKYILVFILICSFGLAQEKNTNQNNNLNVYHLDLSNYASSEYNYQIPEEVRNYKNIETINYGNNYISSIPSWISELKSLKTIRFNNRFLECESATRLTRAGITNPNENTNYKCYEKVVIATDGYDPIFAGLSRNDTFSVINITNDSVLFKNIKDLKITPCGEPIIINNSSVLFPHISRGKNITRDNFHEYHFPSTITEVKLQHCEMGTHEIILKNGDTYYFNNRLLIMTPKGQKKTGYQSEKTGCEKMILEIDDNMYEIKRILQEYYYYADCSPVMSEKAKKQVEIINSFGEYYEWDFQQQDIVTKKVRVFPVEITKNKKSKCMELLENWKKSNPNTDHISAEMMLELEKNGCIRLELLE